MIAVQSSGCQPIVTAFQKGERFAARHENAHSCAYGIRVPQALGDFMILDALRESGGLAVAADETQLPFAQRFGCSTEGISFGLDTAACLAAIERLIEERHISPRERILIVNTAAANKYWTRSLPELPRLDLRDSIAPETLLEVEPITR
jgi:threonine synthase